MFQAVLFDLIGTTVKEEGGDVILSCFRKAFAEHVTHTDVEIMKINRGKEKRVMITEVLKHHQYDLSLVEPVYRSFKFQLENNLHQFSEYEDVPELFTFIKSKGIKMGIGTGLERDVFEKIYDKLGWNKYQFDYIGTGNDTNRSRPHLDMILDMQQQVNCKDSSAFLKVGDTVADIQEGKNAGVATAVILSGSQSKEDLLKQKPDFFLHSLLEVKKIVEGKLSWK